MIIGIGTDIIEVKRIERAISRQGHRFVDRIYSIQEQEYCYRHRDSAPFFAGRFAAKEATVKALGIGFRQGVTWLDIEIGHNHDGKPIIILSELLRTKFEGPELLVTISHCRDYATAFVVYTRSNYSLKG